MEPKIRYCTTEDGVRIAYCVEGEGPPLVALDAFVGAFSGYMNEREFTPYHKWLAKGRTLIVYDGRGIGLSQRDVADFSFGARLSDLTAVVRAAGLRKFALFANGWAAPVAVAFAVEHPRQVSRLVLNGGFSRAADIATWERLKPLIDLCRNNWKLASQTLADLAIRTRTASDPDYALRMGEMFRASITGEAMAEWFTQAYEMDVTPLLPRLRMPTLVLHQRGDRATPFALGRELASRIPNARFVPLEGSNAAPTAMEAEPLLEAAHKFLAEGADTFRRPQADTQKEPYTSPPTGALCTVLFTDLVGHTKMMSRLGDERGRGVLREHERITREVLKAHGGTEVKTMGDGFMASFGSVTKAVECAVALQKAIEVWNAGERAQRAAPLHVRVGLNAGEPIEEDGDLFGATVILASRIAAKADGGEILVADTVRGLCSGKGFLFADRGEFVAKGFEEPVRVYEVSWRE